MRKSPICLNAQQVGISCPDHVIIPLSIEKAFDLTYIGQLIKKKLSDFAF